MKGTTDEMTNRAILAQFIFEAPISFAPRALRMGPRNIPTIRLMDLKLVASLNTCAKGMSKARQVHFTTTAEKPN